MDLKKYYRRIREIEAALEDEFPVLKSLATEAGGLSGKFTETTKSVAARMVVDGVAEIASAAEADEFRRVAEASRRREEERRRGEQVQFHVLSETDLKAMLKAGPKARRE